MTSSVAEILQSSRKKDVLVIGAGLHGLVTAKVLLNDSNSFFDSVTVFEKNTTLGGVWSSNHIYEGLTTNSPLLTYEIPGYPYPQSIRASSAHVRAQDVNQYLRAYAKDYGVAELIQYRTLVDSVFWEPSCSKWAVKGNFDARNFLRHFSHIVICVGLYHTSLNPLTSSQAAGYVGNVYHTSDVGDQVVQRALGSSQKVLIVGAGKSALDIATLLAQGKWKAGVHNAADITMVYRRSHWLSPRNMVRRTIPFEKLLFSRFVAAWLPFAKHPDHFHRIIAESRLGRWCTKQIFKFVAGDFIKSNYQQDLPQTIPKHSFAQSLSGALHVEPLGYLDCVRDGRVKIVEGRITGLVGKTVEIKSNGEESVFVEAETILMATGYTLALPFFTSSLLRTLGLIKPGDTVSNLADLPYLRLYRLIVPPGSTHIVPGTDNRGPYRNIAFNGFAYSLLNPTVAHVTANWISDYFSGVINVPDLADVEQDIDDFHAWQIGSFGAHGAKGVHIGPHGTLYTDVLLNDMGLRTGHLPGDFFNPIRHFREWFRPMYPTIYASVATDQEKIDTNTANALGENPTRINISKGPPRDSLNSSIEPFLKLEATPRRTENHSSRASEDPDTASPPSQYRKIRQSVDGAAETLRTPLAPLSFSRRSHHKSLAEEGPLSPYDMDAWRQYGVVGERGVTVGEPSGEERNSEVGGLSHNSRARGICLRGLFQHAADSPLPSYDIKHIHPAMTKPSPFSGEQHFAAKEPCQLAYSREFKPYATGV